MPTREPLFSRIATSIQGRMDKLAEDNPDGALAKYLWLWQSMGRRPGQRLIPRPIRFFFVASLDLFSLGGWYVRTQILRVARSVGSKEAIMRIYRTNPIAVLTIMAGGAIGAWLTFGPSILWSPADDVTDQVTVNAQAEVQPVVIDSVEVEGNVLQADSTIIIMSGLAPGSPYTISDIQQATRSMWATGHFTDIRVRVEGNVGDGLVTLVWEVDERERAEDAVDRAERILRTRIDEFGVEEPLVQEASGFDLQPNYPNPFNHETTIPFILHEGLFAEGRPTLVSIRIFNVLQQLVASPVALSHASGEGAELIQLEYTQPGTYEAFWDGTDQSGRPVASGLYFVQLNVNGRSKLERLYRARREATAESATRVVEDRIEDDPAEISPVAQWASLYMPDASGGPRVYVRVPIRKDGTGRIDLSLRTDPEDIEQRLFYVDGVRFGSSDLSLDQRDIESIESLKGDAAVALYGEEAFAGVIRVTLKEGAAPTVRPEQRR